MAAFYGNSAKLDHDARAVLYSRSMEKMYQRYPDDKEAAAFYALSLLGSTPPRDKTFANRKQAGAVLQKLFAEEPNHPGVAHYLIHSYDKPQLAALGLDAARRYARIAPASPHALHMPSHIFARVGLWQDDIDSNLASIAATRKTAAMHMGGAGHQFHAMDFLVYAYLQSGHEAEVSRVIEEAKNRPEMKDLHGEDSEERTYALTKFPAIYALEMRHWPEAAALMPVAKADSADEAITFGARAMGAARSGNPSAARKDLEKLGSIQKAMAGKQKSYASDEVEILLQEASAWVAHAEGKDDEALATLRAVADDEDATGAEQTAIPAREMLADLLLELKRPGPALAEYENSLKFTPNRFNGLYGAARAAEMVGKPEKAATYYAQLVKSCEGSGSTRPELSQAKALVAKR
jgi:tetratricopeptide (TPR) repeat protein